MLSITDFLVRAQLPRVWGAELEAGKTADVIERIKMLLGYSHEERARLIGYLQRLDRRAA